MRALSKEKSAPFEKSQLKLGNHNQGELLLHADAIKSNFHQGSPSEEADQLNEGMVQTFMTFATMLDSTTNLGKPIQYQAFKLPTLIETSEQPYSKP